VRLNEEVKADVQVEAKRAIAKGEEVTADDIYAYKAIILTEDDPNAGHITIVLHQCTWALAFDFRRNAAHIGAHVERAASSSIRRRGRGRTGSSARLPAWLPRRAPSRDIEVPNRVLELSRQLLVATLMPVAWI